MVRSCGGWRALCLNSRHHALRVATRARACDSPRPMEVAPATQGEPSMVGMAVLVCVCVCGQRKTE